MTQVWPIIVTWAGHMTGFKPTRVSSGILVGTTWKEKLSTCWACEVRQGVSLGPAARGGLETTNEGKARA